MHKLNRIIPSLIALLAIGLLLPVLANARAGEAGGVLAGQQTAATLCCAVSAQPSAHLQLLSEPLNSSPLQPLISSPTAFITLTSGGFTPVVLTTTVGASVGWFNATSQIYTLTSGSPFQLYLPLIVRGGGTLSAQHAPSAPRANGSLFALSLAPGATVSYTFGAPGSYPYFASNAPQFSGRVVVQAAQGVPLAQRAAPEPAYAGGPLNYTFFITNSGATTATNVTLRDTLPGSVSFSAAAAGCGTGAGIVTCVLAQPLGPGAGASIGVNLLVGSGVVSGTLLVNSAVVSASEFLSGTNNSLNSHIITQALPPDPATVAPAIDQSVPTNLAAATAFLYSGANAIQSGVVSGTIQPQRVTVLRGMLSTRDGAALPGAAISVLDHPEFGHTLSRADGMYDLAVNGGGIITLVYAKPGYLPAQRQARTQWQQYQRIPTVALITVDPNVAAIQLGAGAMQVARGSVISDSSGLRQATLLFPPGLSASLVFSNGATLPLTPTLHVRASEYTVGASGPAAMPGDLPPTSGYTYASEFSIDEAMSAGAISVRFITPVVSYNENFLDFPVGAIVPVGSYSSTAGIWVPEDNGLVVKVLTTTSGSAALDVDGSGSPASPAALAALGITDAERQQLAGLYTSGQSLWRVPLAHFTDYNWAYGPPKNAKPPMQPAPAPKVFVGRRAMEAVDWGTLEPQNQAFRETLNLAGVPFTLNYSNERVPGYLDPYTLNIPLSSSTVPTTLKRIDVQIDVAGRQIVQSFSNAPNQTTSFFWDGKDVYGRTLQGAQPVAVAIGYVYDAVYYGSKTVARSFATSSGAPFSANKARLEFTEWQYENTTLGSLRVSAIGLGGWDLDVHHIYDPQGHVLYLGDGRRRSNQGSVSNVVSAFAGQDSANGSCAGAVPATRGYLDSPHGIAAAPDGSVFIADSGAFGNRICRVTAGGVMTRVTGIPPLNGGFSGDGGPATNAWLSDPEGVAVAPDGSLYIADHGNRRIRRINPSGVITTVAGTGSGCGLGSCGDGGPATQAQIWADSIAVAADGTLYESDSLNRRVRRISRDGIISTIAGNGSACSPNTAPCGDNGPAALAQLNGPSGVAVGPDGSLYIADWGGNGGRIRRVDTSGIITTVAGTGASCVTYSSCGDGGPATQANLAGPASIAVGPDGSLYIADFDNNSVRLVTPAGIISTMMGNGSICVSYYSPSSCGDNGPAALAQFNYAFGVAVGPDGSIYATEFARVRRISPQWPGFSAGDIFLPSEDGLQLYHFDLNGRHLGTLNSLTGATLYTFAYDAAGHLSSVQDANGNTTTIQHDVNGHPTAIVGPYGHTTALGVDANGYLASLSDPTGETTLITSTVGGLLTALSGPKGNTYHFSYDSAGRLSSAQHPGGGTYALSSAPLADGRQVTLTTALGSTSHYTVETSGTGDILIASTFPDGVTLVERDLANGARVLAQPDGMTVTALDGPNARFGMQASVVASLTITTPLGLQFDQSLSSTALLADPTNPLSLVGLTDTVNINGLTYRSAYLAATRTVTRTTPGGRTSNLTLDALGNEIRTQAGTLNALSYAYDARGRPVTATIGSGADARAYVFAYGADGFVASITDPLGAVTLLGHDAVGRIVTQTLPGGATITYGSDPNGNLTSVTPPGRPAHTFAYNAFDMPAAYTPPGVGNTLTQTLYTYNLDRQLVSVARPDGRTITYSYDGAGRISAIGTPRGAIAYAYDPLSGQLATVAAPGGITLAYGYDGALPTRLAWSGPVSGVVTATWDSFFRIASLGIDGNAIAYAYDADSLLTQAGAQALSYDTNGLLTGTALGGVTDTLSYNAFGERISYTAGFSTSALFDQQYARDKLGRITVLTETVGGATSVLGYTYDAAGRLSTVTRDGAPEAGYAYDLNGNRTAYTSTLGTLTASYDPQDRLTQYGTTIYTYTASGERLAKNAAGQVTGYEYDVFGNTTAVTLPAGTRLDYQVDGENRRVGKLVNGVPARGWLYQNGGQLAAELDGTGNVVSRFVYASRLNVPDYLISGTVTYRLLSDQLGSVRLVVNSQTGAIAQRLDYDAYGRVLTDTNPGFQPFGYAGGLYDPDSGLVRFGARDYDAQTGRWTTPDPWQFDGGDTNLYAYVLGDPINHADPSGLIEPWRMVVRTSGHVETKKPDQTDFSPVWRSRLLSDDDLVRTGDNSTAEIHLSDGSIYRLGPNSVANISDYTLDVEGRGIVLKRQLEAFAVKVTMRFGGEGQFKIREPHGVIGARG